MPENNDVSTTLDKQQHLFGFRRGLESCALGDWSIVGVEFDADKRRPQNFCGDQR